MTEGSWESTHVVGANKGAGNKWEVQVTSSVTLSLGVQGEGVGKVHVGGTKTLQGKTNVTMQLSKPDEVMMQLGPLLETMEKNILDSLNAVYLNRASSTVASIRKAGDPRREKELTEKLAKAAAASPL